MESKTCTTCGSELPLSDFYKDCRNKTGYKSQCKTCCKKTQSQRVKKWRNKNPERTKIIAKQFRESQKKKGLCRHCKNNIIPGKTVCEKHYVADIAKKGLDKGDITTAEILLEKFHTNPICPYTGIPLILGVNAHLDHIKSKKNHPELAGDINNVEWISDVANLSKNGFDKEDFIAFCKLVTEKCAPP